MSAEVKIQKFSFPFACSVNPYPEEKVKEAGCVRLKAPELRELKENSVSAEQNPVKVVRANVQSENQTRCTSPSHGALVGAAQLQVGTEASQNGVVLRVEGEDQRPAAKRQLSSESATRSITAVKKSTPSKDGDEHRREQRQRGASILTGLSKKKTRKDLIKSSEVFHQLDSYVISTGAELKEKHVCDVKVIVHNITKGARNELERLRSIWVWLCHNIEYDVSGFLGHSEKLSSPEEVIAAGRGVCCSYSNLCMQMCREVGIECQAVPGHSKGVGYRQGQNLKHVKSDHLWNAVLLEGQWFLLDACWGAGRVDMEHESFVKKFDDFYFLTDPEEFIDSHFPDEEKWQLLDKPISLEEFVKRVFKTSAFFTMGLKLINPHQHHLITDDGEANISIGFSRPVIFTYEIAQHQDLLHHGVSEQKETSSSSFGLLTVSHRSMNLQVLPPARGMYDVKLFARLEKAPTALVWVCSFTIECPEPRAMEEIPENLFLSWGLQPSAASLGVTSSNHSGEVREVEEGVFELVLKTSRPLMVLCELVHPHLEAAVAKRCLATQIQTDSLTCYTLCPLRGFYRLSVFVRDYEKTDAKLQNAANFLLHCKGKVISPDELFPPNLGSSCGPGTRTAEAGLFKFSHGAGVVSTQQGKLNITFHNQRDMELHCTLGKESVKSALPLSRHLFCTYTDTKVTVSLSLPEAGLYRLGLYARISPAGDFSPMCDFVLRNSCPEPRPPFPCVYSAWSKGCVLFEPRTGLLEPLSRVHFRVRVPGALRVSVVGEERTDLKPNKSRIWEGEVFSGSGLLQLKLAATLGESSDMCVLMAFDVKLQNEE